MVFLLLSNINIFNLINHSVVEDQLRLIVINQDKIFFFCILYIFPEHEVR